MLGQTTVALRTIDLMRPWDEIRSDLLALPLPRPAHSPATPA